MFWTKLVRPQVFQWGSLWKLSVWSFILGPNEQVHYGLDKVQHQRRKEMEKILKSQSKTTVDSGLYQLIRVFCWNWVFKFPLFDPLEQQVAFWRVWGTESSEFGVGNSPFDPGKDIQTKVPMPDERKHPEIREKTFGEFQDYSGSIWTTRNENGQINKDKRNFVHWKLVKEFDQLDQNTVRNIKLIDFLLWT